MTTWALQFDYELDYNIYFFLDIQYTTAWLYINRSGTWYDLWQLVYYISHSETCSIILNAYCLTIYTLLQTNYLCNTPIRPVELTELK